MRILSAPLIAAAILLQGSVPAAAARGPASALPMPALKAVVFTRGRDTKGCTVGVAFDESRFFLTLPTLIRSGALAKTRDGDYPTDVDARALELMLSMEMAAAEVRNVFERDPPSGTCSFETSVFVLEGGKRHLQHVLTMDFDRAAYGKLDWSRATVLQVGRAATYLELDRWAEKNLVPPHAAEAVVDLNGGNR